MTIDEFVSYHITSLRLEAYYTGLAFGIILTILSVIAVFLICAAFAPAKKTDEQYEDEAIALANSHSN